MIDIHSMRCLGFTDNTKYIHKYLSLFSPTLLRYIWLLSRMLDDIDVILIPQTTYTSAIMKLNPTFQTYQHYLDTYGFYPECLMIEAYS